MKTKADPSRSDGIQLTRWPHKTFVVIFILSVLVVGGGGLFAGWSVRGADSQTLANSDKPVLVTATVESRTRRLPDFTGELDAAKKVVLNAAVPDGASQAVVTDLPHPVGDTLRSGQLIAAVSGKPAFGLNLEVPLYRELQVGDTGPDVLSLNAALGEAGLLSGTPTSAYTQATSLALRNMYASGHYAAPGAPAGSQITAADITDLPAPSVVISQEASLNSVVVAGAPVVTLSSGADRMTVRVDALTRASLKSGGAAAIAAAGDAGTKTGKIIGISAFKSLPAGTSDAATPPDSADASSQIAFPGYDVTVSIDFGAGGDPWSDETTLNVDFTIPVASQPSVPLTSVREVGASPYVRVLKAGKLSRVRIDIETQQDGWALVKEGGGLKLGEKVLVSQ